MDDKEIDQPEEWAIDGIRLVLTCWACPEQYDAFDGRGRLVGYIRLRGGRLSERCPDVTGQEVYADAIGGPYTGAFSGHEREMHLRSAVTAIKAWLDGI